MSKSIMQSKKECYLCRKDAKALGYHGELTDKGLHKHHIMYGMGSRQQSEHWGVWCWLCHKHHNEDHGLFAVHFNRELDLILRTEAQRTFLRLHSIDDWMGAFNKNYLETWEIENIEKTKYEPISKSATIDKEGTLQTIDSKNRKKTECPDGFWFIE